ncbi:hypothetical protein [Flagellimonas sp. CMM7]|uniref:hypothetical protein n=1 Tax=Flagellimonas sp. CMM7 TaxID=2654676 RepID=UPI0013D0EE7A|nr:hypothetical protein [Flagellimonas sp. CMM7]UII81721.1 hypothetical protein LV704_09440 [Flagellimonas sp. CMM7]
MKKQPLLLTISLLLICQFMGFSQESTPIILNGPEGWNYEKIDFPLDFAPSLPYEGFEELRFAPGMFDTSSSTYFTYLFVLSIQNKEEFPQSELKTLLSEYYKGLCNAVATPKKMAIDTSQIKVRLKNLKKPSSQAKSYSVQIDFFDPFTNGQKILLNMELEVIPDKQTKGVHILSIVSPQSNESVVWKELYSAKEKIKLQKIMSVENR